MKATMKANMILAATLALATVAAQADVSNPTSGQGAPVSNAPKNLARQHLGANLLIYNESNQTYAPTEAAAAWLDDDIATGWPAMTGKQDYLLALPEPDLVNNFCVSARNASGTVTLYAGDEAAPPGSKSWTVLEKDVPIDSINEKLGKPFGRFAKYILIETNLTDSGPWYSVYLYGDKPASAYHIQQRAQPVDPRTIFGPYTNPETSFSVSSIYAHSHVIAAGGDASAWQNAIDDNPGTGTFIPATQKEAGLAIQYDRAYAIQRISVLTDPGTKGKLEFFVVNQPAAPAASGATTSRDASSHYIKVANDDAAPAADQPATPATPAPQDLGSQQPTATINFDGSSSRASIDFTPVNGTTLVARWTPDTAGQPLNLREVDSFGDVALNDYELAPDAVAEGPATDNSAGGGKEVIPSDGGKETLPPAVGEELPAKTPFIPGVPVFPPNIPFSP
ncbi:MAG TPA: hypothetical protein VHY22_10610 [Chthoniobacteraceae bacterium]|jgi:hypothetical protein|nr:hypothetical protein [Chthoniobacteraceae bacterium]